MQLVILTLIFIALITQRNFYFSDRPENVEILGPTKLEVEQTLILICSAESTSPVTYTWILNGKEILNNSAVFIKNPSEESDSGKYICQVRNNLTGRTTFGEHPLSVQGKVKYVVTAGKNNPVCSVWDSLVNINDNTSHSNHQKNHVKTFMRTFIFIILLSFLTYSYFCFDTIVYCVYVILHRIYFHLLLFI